MDDIKMINVKCPYCGKDFEANKQEFKTVCPFCSQEMPVIMAIKYYESLMNNTPDSKEAHGEDLRKLEFLLDEIKGLIEIEEWQRAEERFNEAIELSDTDYRVYMAMVAIKTKNFVDLEDEEHKDYINKAIACADSEAKREIVKEYKEYYQKRNLSKEELQDYTEEENRIKKTRLENSLKTMIPDYMAKEKHNKVFLILFPLLLALGIAIIVVSLYIEEIAWVSLIGAVVAFVGYLFFRTWFTNRDKIKAFNCLLDFYDFVDSKDYNEQTKGVLYTHMKKHADKFLDNAPIVSIMDDTGRLIDYVITMRDNDMNQFMLNSKYFSQFVDPEEEDV